MRVYEESLIQIFFRKCKKKLEKFKNTTIIDFELYFLCCCLVVNVV
jgi:hypothetical protein